MIIAECCEKVSHHELQAARAEQERQILQEELWRQQKDFREVHQQNLTEMEELRKFQSSTFDTVESRKLIEDQNTIMELSGRLQELQNEVNCTFSLTDGGLRRSETESDLISGILPNTPSQKSLSTKIEAKACCHLLDPSSQEHHRWAHFCLNRIP